MTLLIFWFLLINKAFKINASLGENNQNYTTCLTICLEEQCNLQANSSVKSNQKQFFYMKLLGWTCPEECKYSCMWFVVEYYQRVFNHIPQFYGKWPFIRILGIQEPVSAIASIGNLVSNCYMLNKMRKNLPCNAPFKKLWYLFGAISINAWIWSTIFHIRDFSFTEKMDYFCATSLVISQLIVFIIRYLKLRKSFISQFSMYLTLIGCIYFYLSHIYFLGFIEFDYGYNMRVNIILGAISSICWLVWSFYEYFFQRKKYFLKCIISIFLMDILTILEVLDFAPILWILDSHSLWHLSTICIPFYWYGFVIDDNYRVDYDSDDYIIKKH